MPCFTRHTHRCAEAHPYSIKLNSVSTHLVNGVLLGRRPDGEAESDLVHKVGKVVDQVKGGLADATHQVAEEVAHGVDGPSNSDDETHDAERCLHGTWDLVTTGSNGACLAS